MLISSVSSLLPYYTLGLLIASLFVVHSRIVLSFLVATQILFAFVSGILDPMGLLAISVFWGVCALHWRNLSSCEGFNTLRVLVIAGIAIGFASHFIPGFHNLRAYSGILVSPTSFPFTLYLNFDKTIAAVILVITSGLLFHQSAPFRLKALKETGIIAIFCVSLLIPIALLGGYVNYDPKLPEIFWLWTFNNLLFVCFAEEVIFRGIIQHHLMNLTARWNLTPFISILVSALLFAVALPGHRQSGLLFMAFVTLSGLFYGYAYHRTKRLESAILVHFIVNLTHFLLFSYPMAAILAE